MTKVNGNGWRVSLPTTKVCVRESGRDEERDPAVQRKRSSDGESRSSITTQQQWEDALLKENRVSRRIPRVESSLLCLLGSGHLVSSVLAVPGSLVTSQAAWRYFFFPSPAPIPTCLTMSTPSKLVTMWVRLARARAKWSQTAKKATQCKQLPGGEPYRACRARMYLMYTYPPNRCHPSST